MKSISDIPRPTVMMRFAWIRAEEHARTGYYDYKFKHKKSSGRRNTMAFYTTAKFRADCRKQSGSRGTSIVKRRSHGQAGMLNAIRPFWRYRQQNLPLTHPLVETEQRGDITFPFREVLPL